MPQKTRSSSTKAISGQISLEEIANSTNGIQVPLLSNNTFYTEKYVEGQPIAHVSNIQEIQNFVNASSTALLVYSTAEYTLSALEVTSITHFIIDEDGKTSSEGSGDNMGRYIIAFPYNDDSIGTITKILRFTRKNGVTMAAVTASGLTTLTIEPVNSIRVTIGYKSDTGDLVEISDLIYKGESIDVLVQYSEGTIVSAESISNQPLLSVQSTMGVDFSAANIPLTHGVPCSQLFLCHNTTTSFDYLTSFLVSLGVPNTSNPFYRSIKDTASTKSALKFLVKLDDDVTTGFTVNTDQPYLMFSDPDLIVLVAPLGGHFPRFSQIPDEEGYNFLPDTTATHTHIYNMPTTHRVDAADQTNTSSNTFENADSGANDGNRSYETAGRWVRLQAWIYL